jgi:hypothetical protein
MDMNRLTVLALVSAALLASGAQAQLLVGNDDTAVGGTNAWEVDVTAGTSTALWGDGNPEVWGMAYDGGTDTVYVNDGADIYGGAPGAGNPALKGSVTFGGAILTLTGLAWSGGLYGTRNIANEGVYQIDLNTFDATLVLDYDDASYDFGGFAYNPADGLFYGTSDDSTPARGLYSIDVFGGGAITFVADYPAGRTDIDGLAVGDGIAYLVEDEAGDTIHRYDLANGVYLSSLTSPMTSSEVFSGAAWIPEPASLLLLGAIVLLRRR